MPIKYLEIQFFLTLDIHDRILTSKQEMKQKSDFEHVSLMGLITLLYDVISHTLICDYCHRNHFIIITYHVNIGSWYHEAEKQHTFRLIQIETYEKNENKNCTWNFSIYIENNKLKCKLKIPGKADEILMALYRKYFVVP